MGRVSRRESLRSQRGQAAVETAIAMPCMVFLFLGILQLTMLHHAALMTEYAAYQACRTGIVRNGNVALMQNASRFVLAPTVIGGAGLYPAGGGVIREGNQGLVDIAAKVASLEAADAIIGALGGPKVIRVDIVSPTLSEFSFAASKTPWTGGKAVEFDNLGLPNPAIDGISRDDRYRKATRLTIRLRYLYSLAVPFANGILHLAWMASMAPHITLPGMFGAEGLRLGPFGGPSVVEASDEVVTEGAIAVDATPLTSNKGLPILTASELRALLLLRHTGIYVVPLTATYTMRMQSDLHRTDIH